MSSEKFHVAYQITFKGRTKNGFMTQMIESIMFAMPKSLKDMYKTLDISIVSFGGEAKK